MIYPKEEKGTLQSKAQFRITIALTQAWAQMSLAPVAEISFTCQPQGHFNFNFFYHGGQPLP